LTRAGLDTGHRFGTTPRDADWPWGADAEAESCPGLLPSANGLCFHLTHAPDERCNADAFERSWKVSKRGFCRRAEQVLRRDASGATPGRFDAPTSAYFCSCEGARGMLLD